jgi:hypothetical protein
MSTRFIGSVRGSGKDSVTEALRRGNTNGVTTLAASDAGSVVVHVWRDTSNGRDRYQVTLADWPSRRERCVIASGFLDEADSQLRML